MTIVETSDSELAVCLSHAVSLLRRISRATVPQADRADIEQLCGSSTVRCASPCGRRRRPGAAGDPSPEQRHEPRPGPGADGRGGCACVAAAGWGTC